MMYVYILQSLRYPNQRYVGLTGDVDEQLKEHNSGKSRHTAKYIPWKLDVSIGFNNDEQALKFECYLKSGSGRAFAKKHFYDPITNFIKT